MFSKQKKPKQKSSFMDLLLTFVLITVIFPAALLAGNKH